MLDLKIRREADFLDALLSNVLSLKFLIYTAASLPNYIPQNPEISQWL